MRIKIKFEIILMLLMVIFLPTQVEAARLYFDPVSIKAGIGSEVQVRVMLDTGGEKINAVGSAVKYPTKLLKLKGWNDGNSVISFWVQPIRADSDSITIQGMVPGGYQGEHGQLIILNFDVIGEGTGSLSFAGTSEVLLNDGKGTMAKLTLEGLAVRVEGVGQKMLVSKVEDREMPEEFVPVISRDLNLFDNRYFIVFSTQDKGSGMDHYEISEVRGMFKPTPVDWIVAESPIMLKDQELKSWIFVKAIDMNGNAMVEVVKPTNVPLYQQPTFIIFLILLVGAILLSRNKNDKRKVKN